jgi:hypothetical protein
LGQPATSPPSITISEPVMNEAAGESRWTTLAEMPASTTKEEASKLLEAAQKDYHGPAISASAAIGAAKIKSENRRIRPSDSPA